MKNCPSNVGYASNEPYRTIRSSTSSTVESDPVTVYFEEDIEAYHSLVDRNFPQIGHESPLNARTLVLRK